MAFKTITPKKKADEEVVTEVKINTDNISYYKNVKDETEGTTSTIVVMTDGTHFVLDGSVTF